MSKLGTGLDFSPKMTRNPSAHISSAKASCVAGTDFKEVGNATNHGPEEAIGHMGQTLMSTTLVERQFGPRPPKCSVHTLFSFSPSLCQLIILETKEREQGEFY